MTDTYSTGEDDETRRVRDMLRARADREARAQYIDPAAPDPEQASTVRRLSQESGLPEAQVQLDLPGAERAAAAARASTALEAVPRLREWISDPHNANVARDDVENLSVFERVSQDFWRWHAQQIVRPRTAREQQADDVLAMNPLTAPLTVLTGSAQRRLLEMRDPAAHLDLGRYWEAGERDVEMGRLQYRRADLERSGQALSPEEEARLEELRTRQDDWGPFVIGPTLRVLPQQVEGFSRGWREGAQGRAEGFESVAGTEAERRERARRSLSGDMGPLENMASNLTDLTLGGSAAGLGAIGGFGRGYLSTIYEAETGGLYDSLRQEGIDVDIAYRAASEYGAWATALEFTLDATGLRAMGATRLMLRPFLKESALRAAGSPVVRAGASIIGGAAAGGAEEASQRVAEIIHEDLARQEGQGSARDVGQAWRAALTPEAIRSILESGYIGAQASGGIATAPASANFALDVRSSQQAEHGAGVFEEMTRAAQASRLNERGLASTLESAISAVNDSQVYIDADRFIEHFQSRGADAYAVAEELGIGEDVLVRAVRGSGQIEVPTSVFAARVLRIPEHASLAEHARIAPDAATAAEAKVATERLQAEVERIVEETTAVKSEAEIGQIVEARMRDLFVRAEEEGGPRADISARYAKLVAALPRTLLARARQADPVYAERLEGQLRKLFGEKLDVAGPARDLEAQAGVAEMEQRGKGPDAGPVRNDRWEPPEGVQMSERMRSIAEMAMNGASNEWIANEWETSLRVIGTTLSQIKARLGGKAPWERAPPSGNRRAETPIEKLVRAREQLIKSGYPANRINAILAERFDMKAPAVGMRLMRYDRAQAAQTVEAAPAETQTEDRRPQPFDLKTVEGRQRWFEEETYAEPIPGEAADARNYGFALDTGEIIVMSIAPEPTGSATVEWTFLERLKAQAENPDAEIDMFGPGTEKLGLRGVMAAMARVLAILEADMAEFRRDSYVYTPNNESLEFIYKRVVNLSVEQSGYQTVEDGAGQFYLVRDGAEITRNGTVIRSPENADVKIEWPQVDPAEVRDLQNAYYERLERFAKTGSVERDRSDGGRSDADGRGAEAGGGVSRTRGPDALFQSGRGDEQVAADPALDAQIAMPVVAKRFAVDPRDFILMFNEGLTDGELAAEIALSGEGNANGPSPGSVAVWLTNIRSAVRRARDADAIDYLASRMAITPDELTAFVDAINKHRKPTILGEARNLIKLHDNNTARIIAELGRWAEENTGRPLDRSALDIHLYRARQAMGIEAPQAHSPKNVDDLNQGAARGSIRYQNFRSGEFGTAMIRMGEASDLSTFLHEFGHLGHLVLESVATDPQAPQEFKQMWGATLQWWGVSQDEWSSFGVERKRDYFETWARSFEAYLMEGKAPSFSLREAFAAFRFWLTNFVYKIFKLDHKLNPQIRDVFDRLLATDQELTEARAAMGADFNLKREWFPRMTDEEWTALQTAIGESKEAATNELSARLAEPIVRKDKRWWRSERERVRTTAEIVVDSDPARRAYEWLAFSEWRALPVEQNEEGAELPLDASLAMPEDLPVMSLSAEAMLRDYGDNAFDGLPIGLRPLRAEDVEAALDNAMALKRQGRGRQPQRLWSFIKAQGGIKDEGGEIRQALGSGRARPGLINNVSGRSADDLALAAWEAGYFGAVPRKGGALEMFQNARREVIDVPLSGGRATEVIRNPSLADLMRLSVLPRELGPEARQTAAGQLRYIQDAKGDVYVFRGWDAIHDDVAAGMERIGRRIGGYQRDDGNRTDFVRFGYLRRDGDTFVSGNGEPLSARVQEMVAPRGARAAAAGAEQAGRGTQAARQTFVESDALAMRVYRTQLDAENRIVMRVGRDGLADTVFWSIEGPAARAADGTVGLGGQNTRVARQALNWVGDTLARDARQHRPRAYSYNAGASRSRAYQAMASRVGGWNWEADGNSLIVRNPLARLPEARGEFVQGPMRGTQATVPDGGARGDGSAAYHDQLRSQGFDVEMPLYHGTAQQFDGFRNGREGATFFTSDPDLAATYAARDGTTPNVRPVFIRPGRTLTFHDTEVPQPGLNAERIAQARAEGYDSIHTVIDTRGTQDRIVAMVRERFPIEPEEAIRARLTPRAEGIKHEWAVLDPENIATQLPTASSEDAAAGFEMFQDDISADRRPTPRELLDALIDDIKNVRQVYSVRDEAAAAAYQNRADAVRWFEARDIDLDASKEDIRAQIEAALTKEAAEQGEGWHSDDIAPWFGFESGDAMIQALRGLKPRAVAIEENIERRLEDRYGDPFKDGTVAEAARFAAHVEAQSRKIELELEAIQRATGGKRAPVGNAARAFAERQITVMSVKQVRGYDTYLAGERRAARNALEAVQKGDMIQAGVWKQRQLVNFHLYRLARSAAEEMDKAQRYFQKFDRSAVRAKIHAPLLDQIDQALEGVDVRARPFMLNKRRQSFLAWFDEMKAEGLEHMVAVDPEFLDKIKQRPFASLTMEEARGMRDAVRNFEHIGRRWREVLASRDERLLDEAVGEMAGTMATVKPFAYVNPDTHSADAIESIDRGRQRFHAQLSRVEFVARAMDGMKDNGPVWNGLFRPLTEARDREEMRQEQAQGAIENLFSVYTAKERADMWVKRRHYPQVPNRDGTKMGRSFTKQEILAIALNTGNDYNRAALIEGDNWSDAQVRALLDAAMDQRDWQFVQSAWDYVDGFWPEIAALYEKSTGVVPPKVEATPFQNRYGEWRGGYWHLEYDYGRDQRVREEMAHGAVQEAFGGFRLRTQTPNGFSKARQGSGGRPVRLELSILTEHVNEVIHDLEFRLPVLNAWRLIKHSTFREAFVRAAGQDQYDQLKPWLQYVATERMPPERGFAGIIKLLRRNTPIALMGYAISTVAQQPAGLMGTFHRVGTGRVMGKALEMAAPWNWGNWVDHARFINSRSTLMRNRTKISQREIREMVQEINSQAHVDAVSLLTTGDFSQKREAMAYVTKLMQRYALFPLAFVDKWVSSMAWKAAYDKALAGKVAGVDPQSEKDVIAFADQVIRTTFGSGRPEDMSPVMRSTEIGKLITPAFSYFNTQYNQLYNEQLPGMMRGRISPLEFSTFIVFTIVLQALLSQFLAGRWDRDEDESEEARAVRLASEVALMPVAGVPLVRDMTRSALQSATTGSTFGSTVPALGALSSTGTGVGGTVHDLATDGEISRRSARDLTMAAGYWFGLPSNAMWRAGEAATDVATGEDDLSDPADTAAEAFLRDRR